MSPASRQHLISAGDLDEILLSRPISPGHPDDNDGDNDDDDNDIDDNDDGDYDDGNNDDGDNDDGDGDNDDDLDYDV